MRRQYYNYIYLKELKIAATNDVGDDGIVGGSSAITKTMRIQACLIGRQIRIPFFGHGFPPCKRILWIQKILRLWLMRISQKIPAAGQTKILV
jgi:hypothetical protein